MNKEAFNFQEDEELIEALQRFEDMQKTGEIGYFDVFQFEHIIDNFISQNKYGSALRVANIALEQHPSSISIMFKKAHIFLNIGEISNCLSITNLLINIEDTNNELYTLIGSCHLILGDKNKAEENFSKALEFSIDNKDETLYNIGFVYEKCEYIDHAISLFQEALKYNPNNEIVLYEIAYCYDKIKDYYKSIQHYNRFLDNDPFSETAWFNLGIAYNNINENKKAINAYQFALAINDVFPSAIFNIADSYMSLKNYDKAIEYLEMYTEIDESNEEVYIMLGNCFLHKNMFSTANKFCKKVLTINQKNDKAWFLSGLAFMRKKEKFKSLECFNKALKLEPKKVEYLYWHAKVCSTLNYINETIDSYESMCDLESNNVKYWLKYSKFLNDKGLKSIAIEKLYASLFFTSDNPLILYRLSAYLLESMEEEKALRYLDEALTKDFNKHRFFYRSYPEARLNETVKQFIKNFKNDSKSGVYPF